MIRFVISLILILTIDSGISAQRITRRYDDISFSEALVIKIRTLDKQGEGWSGGGYATASYNKWFGSVQTWSTTFRADRLEVFGNVWETTRPAGADNVLTNEVTKSKYNGSGAGNDEKNRL